MNVRIYLSVPYVEVRRLETSTQPTQPKQHVSCVLCVPTIFWAFSQEPGQDLVSFVSFAEATDVFLELLAEGVKGQQDQHLDDLGAAIGRPQSAALVPKAAFDRL